MKQLVAILFACILFFSCKENTQTTKLLSNARGKANEILVVIPSQKWKSEAGDAIKGHLSQTLPGLPQDEPTFSYYYTPPTNMNGTHKRQRNIIVARIGAQHKTTFDVVRNRWAKPQVVVFISAPTVDEFIKTYTDKGDKINEIFRTAEFERLTSSYRKSLETNIVSTLQKKHEIGLVVPKGYRLNMNEKNFVWLIKDYRDIIEGILIYHYPYTDPKTFDTEFLLDKRDDFGKKYVVGEVEGSYMSTERNFDIFTREYKLNGDNYTKELRGLWRIREGMAMGGPFVSITQVDQERNRIVTVEGFVFGPGHEKRNLMRNVEAIVYSLSFPKANTSNPE